jgi:hypothetical protein
MVHKFSDREVEFAQYIKENPPKKIWYGYIDYVFDYGSFYFKIECTLEDVDSPHVYSEAVIGKLTKHKEAFVPEEHTKLVCQDKKIEKIFISRAVLHFSIYDEFSKTKQFLNKARQKLKTFLTRKKDPLGDMFAKSAGMYNTFVNHPQSTEAKNTDPKYSNLIDCGLLIRVEGKFLKAFVEENGYGFQIWDDKYFFDKFELKEIYQQYELIEI